MRSGGFRVIFDSFGKVAIFGVDCKIFEDRVAVLAAPEMVVFFVIQFAIVPHECPNAARLNVFEFGDGPLNFSA